MAATADGRPKPSAEPTAGGRRGVGGLLNRTGRGNPLRPGSGLAVGSGGSWPRPGTIGPGYRVEAGAAPGVARPAAGPPASRLQAAVPGYSVKRVFRNRSDGTGSMAQERRQGPPVDMDEGLRPWASGLIPPHPRRCAAGPSSDPRCVAMPRRRGRGAAGAAGPRGPTRPLAARASGASRSSPRARFATIS